MRNASYISINTQTRKMTQTELVPHQALPEMVEGESNVLWGVPDDVLLLLKQYDFSEHVQPTYTVTGSPNGLHFICVWPTKDSKLGDKVLQDIMKIHQITDIKTADACCQTDDLSDGNNFMKKEATKKSYQL